MLDMAALGMVGGSLMWSISIRANPIRPMESRALAAFLMILVGIAPVLIALPFIDAIGRLPVVGPGAGFIAQPLLAALAMYTLGRHWTQQANARNQVRDDVSSAGEKP